MINEIEATSAEETVKLVTITDEAELEKKIETAVQEVLAEDPDMLKKLEEAAQQKKQLEAFQEQLKDKKSALSRHIRKLEIRKQEQDSRVADRLAKKKQAKEHKRKVRK